MFEVRVPMTSANVACGFDTLGIAFQEYSIFDFELSDRLEFVNFEEEFCNEDNLVYIAFKKALNFLNKTINEISTKQILKNSCSCPYCSLGSIPIHSRKSREWYCSHFSITYSYFIVFSQ